MTERILKYPGFLYEIQGRYYYMGKWICKECSDTEASDSLFMYRMSRKGHEEPETNMYFQKLRAFSDFALEVPYNPEKIQKDLEELVENLPEAERISLEKQLQYFEEDYPKYCGKSL